MKIFSNHPLIRLINGYLIDRDEAYDTRLGRPIWAVGFIFMITIFCLYIMNPELFKITNHFDSILIGLNVISLLDLISIVIFYLDGYKLSDIYSIRIFQYLCLYGTILMIVLFINIYAQDINNLYLDDKDSVNLHGHVNVTKDAASEISKGISSLGSSFGLGGAMVGVGAAVGKTIAKSGMPPLQKAGVVIGASVLGGMAHLILSRSNRNKIFSQDNINNNPIISDHISKFMDITSCSPLEGMLSDIQSVCITCLGLIYILIIQLFFKFYSKNNIQLNFHHFLGYTFNNNLNKYINQIIYLNQKMSIVYIWIIVVLLILGFCIILYAATDVLNNLEKYIQVHNNIK